MQPAFLPALLAPSMGQTNLYTFLQNVGRGTASGEQPAALHTRQHRHMHCVLHLWGLPARSNEHCPNLCRIARGSGARVALQPAVLLPAVAQQPYGAPLVWRLRFVKRAGGSMKRIDPKGHNTVTNDPVRSLLSPSTRGPSPAPIVAMQLIIPKIDLYGAG